MNASKDKKEAPKGIIQSKNTTFVHQSTSSSNNFKIFYCIILYLSRTVFCTCSRGVLYRVTILAEWLRHINDLTVGETAAPACFLRENAEGAGMPPLLSH